MCILSVVVTVYSLFMFFDIHFCLVDESMAGLKKGQCQVYKYLTLPNPFRPTIPDHQIINLSTMKKLLSSRTIPAVEGGKTQKQKRCIEYICSQLRTHSIQTSITCSPSSHNSKSKRRTN